MADGPFAVTVHNKSFEGALLEEFTGKSESDCHFECLQNRRCKSVNYNQIRSICILNSKILGDHGTSFKPKMGWNYQSTNYSSMKVSLVLENNGLPLQLQNHLNV